MDWKKEIKSVLAKFFPKIKKEEILEELMKKINLKKRKDYCIIGDEYFFYFFSDDKIIAVTSLDKGITLLDSRYWNYSKTIEKYRNQFLNESINETRKKIESGIYKLENLN